MTDYVLLNDVEHADLKVVTDRSEKYGDKVKFAMTFPFEYRNIQSCYPIFFQKDSETGVFFSLALFGFDGNENLFLSADGWNASYIPIMITRQPFLIGFQQDTESPDAKKAVVTIDMDNPRVNVDEGEELFLEHGGTSEYLSQATENLELIHQAHKHSEKFIQALLEYELLEPFTLDIELNDGSKNQLLGFYTIKEESVQQLNAEALGILNEQGFLQPIYMVLASHSCIGSLVDLKNKTL